MNSSLPQCSEPPAPILAVDDEETDRLLLKRALTAAGIDRPCVTFATGGAMLDALLDVLRGAPLPLLCFVDVKMAGMGGLDVLRWIRAQNPLHEMPVVMLSSADAPELLTEALRWGAQCYIAKFPRPEELRTLVAAAEAYRAAATHTAFELPCNLLLSVSHPVG